MKILCMTPVWKRPEILRLFLKSFEKLKIVNQYLWKKVDLELLVILSPEDPHYYENLDLLNYPGIKHFNCANYPFGAKKNFGGKKALELEWDYLLELNSDRS